MALSQIATLNSNDKNLQKIRNTKKNYVTYRSSYIKLYVRIIIKILTY